MQVFIPGGYAIQFHNGWFGMVTGRSKNNRRGIIVPTGIIDTGYTGIIGAELINTSPNVYSIEPGERIAQLILLPGFTPKPIPVERFAPTERGNQGWGSSDT